MVDLIVTDTEEKPTPLPSGEFSAETFPLLQDYPSTLKEPGGISTFPEDTEVQRETAKDAFREVSGSTNPEDGGAIDEFYLQGRGDLVKQTVEELAFDSEISAIQEYASNRAMSEDFSKADVEEISSLATQLASGAPLTGYYDLAADSFINELKEDPLIRASLTSPEFQSVESVIKQRATFHLEMYDRLEKLSEGLSTKEVIGDLIWVLIPTYGSSVEQGRYHWDKEKILTGQVGNKLFKKENWWDHLYAPLTLLSGENTYQSVQDFRSMSESDQRDILKQMAIDMETNGALGGENRTLGLLTLEAHVKGLNVTDRILLDLESVLEPVGLGGFLKFFGKGPRLINHLHGVKKAKQIAKASLEEVEKTVVGTSPAKQSRVKSAYSEIDLPSSEKYNAGLSVAPAIAKESAIRFQYFDEILTRAFSGPTLTQKEVAEATLFTGEKFIKEVSLHQNIRKSISPVNLRKFSAKDQKEITASLAQDVKKYLDNKSVESITRGLFNESTNTWDVVVDLERASSEKVAHILAEKKFLLRKGEYDVIKTPENGYTVSVRGVMDESGLQIHTNEALPSQNLRHRLLMNANLSVSERDWLLRTMSTDKKALMSEAFHRLQKPVRKLSGSDKRKLDSFLAHNTDSAEWGSFKELKTFVEKRFPNDPEVSDKLLNGYSALKDLSDMDYLLSGADSAKRMERAGLKKLMMPLKEKGKSGFVYGHETKMLEETAGSIYIPETGKVFAKGSLEDKGRLTEELEILGDPDAWSLVVPFQKDLGTLKEGTHAEYILVKKASLTEGRIGIDVLNYVPNGRRVYKNRRAKVTQNILNENSEVFGTKTLHTFGRFTEAREAADSINEAIVAYMRVHGIDTTPILGRVSTKLDVDTASKIIGEGGTAYKDLDEFATAVSNKELQLTKVEPLKDQQLPSNYQEDIVFKETGATGNVGGFVEHALSSGELYGRKRGAVLKSYEDISRPQPLLDATETLGLMWENLTNRVAYGDYLNSSVKDWLDRYATGSTSVLKVPVDGNDLEKFNAAQVLSSSGKFTPEINAKIIEAKNQMRIIKELAAKQETAYAAWWKGEMNRLADWVDQAAPGSARAGKISKVFSDLGETTVDSKMRTLTYDLRMGIWNPIQLAVQSHTLLLASTIEPAFAKAGLSQATFARWIAHKGYDADLIKHIANSKPAKLLHGLDEEQFTKMIEAYKLSGKNWIDNILPELQDVRLHGKQSMLRKGLRKGRSVVMQIERQNRATGWTIAYNKWLKEHPGKHLVDLPADIRNIEAAKISREGNLLSGNMVEDAMAIWQRAPGISMTSQFLSYNAHILELMLGPQATKAQKTRLILGQYLLYGSDAVIPPFVSSFMERGIQNSTGAEDKSIYQRAVFGGGIELLAYLTTDAEIDFGERFAVMPGLENVITGFFNENIFEASLGPSADVFKDGWGFIADALYSIEDLKNGRRPLLAQNAKQHAQFFSTASHVVKVWTAFNLLKYQTKSGNNYGDINYAEAWWMALTGTNLHVSTDMQDLYTFHNVRTKVVDFYSSIVNKQFNNRLSALERGDMKKADQYENEMHMMLDGIEDMRVRDEVLSKIKTNEVGERAITSYINRFGSDPYIRGVQKSRETEEFKDLVEELRNEE